MMLMDTMGRVPVFEAVLLQFPCSVICYRLSAEDEQKPKLYD